MDNIRKTYPSIKRFLSAPISFVINLDKNIPIALPAIIKGRLILPLVCKNAPFFISLNVFKIFRALTRIIRAYPIIQNPVHFNQIMMQAKYTKA